MMGNDHEHWAAGDAYEQFMGRWSRDVATHFLQWLGVTPQQRWLDVGCGTGALTQAIVSSADPHTVVGLDASLDFVLYANRQTIPARFVVADGSALPLQDAAVDAIVSGLALNFMLQPAQVAAEMVRAVRPGGVVAAYVWDYAGKMEFLRYFWDVAVTLDPSAASQHEGNRFPLCRPEALHQLWQTAGFENIVVEALDVPTVFDSFESYWQPFMLGNFPAPKYAMSLNPAQRDLLQDRLRAAVPVAEDGSIHLIPRVWAIRGDR